MTNINMVSNLIAVCVGIFTLLIFIVIAYSHGRRIKDTKDFLFAGQTLNERGVASNLAATASSLAGVLFFFLIQTPAYGWVTLLVIIFVGLGHLLFLRSVKDLKPSPENTGSVFRFIRWRTESFRLASLANILVVFTYLIILLIELVIGATIFAYFLPWLPSAEILGLIILSILVMIYVNIGGFKTVTYSDSWQWGLMTVGLVLTFLLVLSSYFYTSDSISKSLIDIFVVFKTPTGSLLVLGTFVINLIVVNLTLPLCQIGSWQRFASSISYKKFKKGIWKGLNKRFWWVWTLVVMLAAVISAWKGQVGGLNDIFSIIQNLGYLGNLIVFPLLFVGLMAALVSTADSMLISLLLGVDDIYINSKKAKKEKEGKLNRKNKGSDANVDKDLKNYKIENVFSRGRYWIISIIILLFSVVIYQILNSTPGPLSYKIIGLMFAGYGQIILLFPILWYSINFPERFQNINYKIVVSTFILSWLVIWTLSIKGIFQEQLYLSHISAVVGIIISWTGLHIGTMKKRST